MRILVTGGAGLIGMAARKTLPSLRHTVVATDITDFGRHDPDLRLLSLSDAAGFERLIVQEEIEAIVHGGGISGPVMARTEPVRVVDVNVAATTVLLDIARRRKLKRFLLLSSHVVYGDAGSELIGEDRGLHPSTTYAATKVAGEALVESFWREWGLSGASLRLTRVYGPYRRANCFLRDVLLNSASGALTTIPREPGYIYHYLHVDDVVTAIAACLRENHLPHCTYNITSGEALTMDQVASIVLSILPKARIQLLDGVDDAPEVQRQFDLRRIAADTGWVPRFDLAKGFANYARDFVQDATITA